MTFRDDQVMCPACAEPRALGPQPDHESRLRCESCRGVFIAAAELQDMINALAEEPWFLDEQTVKAGTRTCPRCTATMHVVALFSIPIDRCLEHGVWFDGKELEMVLEAASGVDPKLMAEGPQYAELGPLAKLKAWFGSRHNSPRSPRRPTE